MYLEKVDWSGFDEVTEACESGKSAIGKDMLLPGSPGVFPSASKSPTIIHEESLLRTVRDAIRNM